MVAVEGVPKAIADHGIDVLHVTHFVSCAQMCDVGAKGHVFLTASGDDVRIAKLNVLCCKRHGAKARATNLVNGPSGRFDWKTRIHMCLTRRVLALTCCQNLTKDRLGNVSGIYAGAFDKALQHRCTQIMCRRICE